MVITVLLLIIVVTTVVIAPWTDDSVVMRPGMDEAEARPEDIDLDEIKEAVVRRLFDDSGKMINPDERLAGVSRDHYRLETGLDKGMRPMPYPPHLAESQ